MQILYEFLNNTAECFGTPIGTGLSIVILLGMAILLLCTRRRIALRANIGDYAAISYVLVQLLTLLTSRARTNTVHFIAPYASALCLYFSVRLLFRWPITTTKLLLRLMVSLGFTLVVADLALQVESIRSATSIFPASSLSSFRSLLPLVGMATKNDDLAVVLSILPYALAGAIAKSGANRYFWIVSTFTTAGLATVLILSFSRSIYFALGVLITALVLLTKRGKAASFRRLGIVLATLCLFAVAIVMYLRAQRAVLQTFEVNATTSQERSTLGHFAIWRETVPVIVEHPLLGIGGGTDGFVAMGRLGHSALPFVARNYNAPLDVLESSGIVGFLLYGLFLIYPMWITTRLFFTSKDRYPLPMIAMVLNAGLFALILRDMTYSSLIMNGPTIAIAWITVALLQNANSWPSETMNQTHSWGSIGTCVCVTLGLSILSLVLSIRLELAEHYYARGCTALWEEDYSQAHGEFGRAIQLEPKQPMFYAADALTSATEALGTSLAQDPWRGLPRLTQREDEMLSAAETRYSESLRLAGDDSTFWSNLAWVEAFRGQRNMALRSFERAVQADPNDSASRIGLGLLYERDGLEKQALEQYTYAIAASPRIVDSEFFSKLCKRNPVMADAAVVESSGLISNAPAMPIGLALLGKLHMFDGNWKLAHNEYAKALDLLPNLSYTWANLGVLDLTDGNRNKAYSEFERALFLDEGNRVATNMLAEMDFDNDKIVTAENLYGRTILMPLSSEHSGRAWRIYRVMAPAQDDLVPSGLLSYISPKIQLLDICDTDWLSSLGDSGVHFPDVDGRILAQETLCNATK